MQIQFYQPRASLADFIQTIWSWEGAVGTVLPRLMPEAAFELVFYYRAPFHCSTREREFGRLPGIHLVGLRKGYCDIRTTGPVGFLALRFRPPALQSFIAESPATWTDDFATARHLWGDDGERLEESFCRAGDNLTRLVIIEDFLEARLAQYYQTDSRLEKAIRALRDQPECSSLGEIAARTGWGVRSLQRVFRDGLGVPPKTFQRLHRFERLVIRCLGQNDKGYLQRGLELGYYDQAHIIHDFADFLGISPGAFLTKNNYLSYFYNTGSF